MASVGVSALFTAVVGVVLYLMFRYAKRLSWLRTVPHPGPAYPLIGHAHVFMGVGPAEILPKIMEICTANGQWRKMGAYLSTQPLIFLYHPETVQPILSSNVHIEKSPEYQFLVPWIQEGLLMSKGEKWRRRRKLLTPSFHFRILDDSMVFFNKNADTLADMLLKEGRGAIDVFPFITRCTLDVMLESSMGKSLNIQEKKDSEYVRAITDIVHLVQRRQISPWLWSDSALSLAGLKRVQDKCLEILHGFTRSVIRDRRREFEQEGDDHHDGERKLAFLDMLLRTESKDGERFTDSDMQEEVDTFMFEGHDTTTCSLSWTLLLLANHPEVQERCYQEQVSVFGDGVGDVGTEHLPKMIYLEAVLKESLRLYPSVPIVGRKIEEDCVIDGVEVSKGTSAMCFIHLLHRNPQIWPEPNKFDPERFLDGSKKKAEADKYPYAYVPFSAGPRNCIGQRFAVMEEKTILSKLLRRVKIVAVSKVEDVRPVIEIITRPEEGTLLVKVEPR